MEDRLYGLLGRKLGHSFSPQIHARFGNPAYKLCEQEPEDLAAFLSQENMGGVNVTIPYKQEVMKYCHFLSDEAKAIGSVNTIIQHNRQLFGYNTDACGLRFMARCAKISFSGKKVIIFGSGGSSLTAQAVAKQEGAAKVIVISRLGEDNYDNLNRHYDAQILVNATPLGMYPHIEGMPADPAPFSHCEGVLDLVYNPLRTLFLMRAEDLNLPHANGLSMLVTQAKAAEELFFNRSISDSENEQVLHEIKQSLENIVLIGMPGSGKTSIGRVLAQLTGREVIDIDHVIESQAGCSIPEIFTSQGEAVFRNHERRETEKAGLHTGKIIIPGGGVIKDERNYPSLHRNSRIYHITRDTALLEKKGRPLSEGADLNKMYCERLPMYKRFRDAVVENAGTLEETANTIWRDFCENSCNQWA